MFSVMKQKNFDQQNFRFNDILCLLLLCMYCVYENINLVMENILYVVRHRNG